MDKPDPSPSGASAAEPTWLTDYRKIMEGHDAAARSANFNSCGCDVCKLTRATIASRVAAPRQPEGPDEARFTLYCACKECTVAIQADTRTRFFCEACSWWRTSGPHFHDCDHTMPGKQGAANGQ